MTPIRQWKTRTRHGSVHMSITHRPTLTLQLHTSICSVLVVQVVSALLHGNWQDFNRQGSSRGPSAIAELLVNFYQQLSGVAVVQLRSPGGAVTYYVCIRISWNANFYFSSEIYLIFFTYLCTCELSFTFCDFDTVAFFTMSTVVMHHMLMLIS